MYKKKEIIIIILIIITTIALAFLPTLISNMEKEEEALVTTLEEESTTKKTTIEITLEGELKEDMVTLIVPYGASYGYIISKAELYLNTYSIIDSDLTKRYYEDTTIKIESSDTNCYDVVEESEAIVDPNKISISTGSKADLMSLYGIGEKRAETIIEYREAHEIDSWETLKDLLGVSDEIIEAIQEKAVL